ncbi:MAG: alpha-glycosidase [Fusobacteria bacterium]|nr:alpha-glycosidase [Fusobacteriota bacterium]
MLLEAIYHKKNSEYIYGIDDNHINIRVRTKKNDMKNVVLNYVCKYKFIYNNEKFKKIKMVKYASDTYFDYYESIVKYDVISFSYYFTFDNSVEKLNYGNYKFYNYKPKHDTDLFIFAYLAKKDLFKVPSWFKESIIYHIFPDRFSREKNFINNNKFESWDTPITATTHLGGNIKGIIEKIDYLKELGVNLIYLNPIFKSKSTHKYDTIDYYNIDENFGSNEDFKELVDIIHKNNMKIVLDGVFNHSGDDFFAFQDVIKNEENSKYKDWFEIDNFPVKNSDKTVPNYRTFGYYHKMPKLIMENEESINYFIDVMKYWIEKYNVDGWRLDVADEVSHEFWKKAKLAIKNINENAVLIGEVWYDAKAWLNGDMFDSVMNYIFYYAMIDFVAYQNIDVKEFVNKINFVKGTYKKQAYDNLCNLIDSHDTPRFLFHAKENKAKLKIAAGIQFTYEGVPYLYYGDEIGLTGGKDPDCRRAMIWDETKQDLELLDYYKKLIKLRKDRKSLIYGDFKIIENLIDDNIFAYERKFDKEKTFIYVNAGKKDTIFKLSSCKNDLITGKRVKRGEILLKKESILILG